MPRPICVEDGFEYRVKGIFRRLREEYATEETDTPFEEWLEKNHKTVGAEFLSDVESYMGIPSEVDDD